MGPGPTLFTSHTTNGYLWSLWPTDESYPCFWKQPLLLQGRHYGFLYYTNAAAVCCCCLLWLLLLMFILSFYPLKQTILTHQCACSHARRCLSASKMGEIHRHTHARTHAKYGLSNGGSSHAVSLHRVYPFHSGSIPRSYSTSLLFSSFNLSLSPCPLTSISASVWAQLWIRSLWVNP